MPDGFLAQSVLINNTSVGINKMSIMAEYLGGDIDIGGNSVYYGVSISLMGHIFIGGDVTSESITPT